jgi:hypothetical protein
VSDDTTDLLLDYLSRDEREARGGDISQHLVGGSGHIFRLPFVISMTDHEEGM